MDALHCIERVVMIFLFALCILYPWCASRTVDADNRPQCTFFMEESSTGLPLNRATRRIHNKLAWLIQLSKGTVPGSGLNTAAAEGVQAVSRTPYWIEAGDIEVACGSGDHSRIRYDLW